MSEFTDELKGFFKGLYKSEDDVMLTGVCAGIGKSVGWPAWTIRLLALLFAYPGSGAIIVLYIVLAIVLPEGEQDGQDH